MATKPATDEWLNAKKRLLRQEEEAMGAMTPAAAATGASSAQSGGGMSQASFSGYPKGRAPRPSEAELEAIVAKKKKD